MNEKTFQKHYMKIFFKINFNKIYNTKNIHVYKLIIKNLTYNVNILYNITNHLIIII